jgi:hypothetical protein
MIVLSLNNALPRYKSMMGYINFELKFEELKR